MTERQPSDSSAVAGEEQVTKEDEVSGRCAVSCQMCGHIIDNCNMGISRPPRLIKCEKCGNITYRR